MEGVTGGFHSKHPVDVAWSSNAVESDWSSVNLSPLASHLVTQAMLRDHVSLLASVDVVGGETDGGAGEGANLAIPAVDPLQGVFFAYFAIDNSNVKSYRNTWTFFHSIAVAVFR